MEKEVITKMVADVVVIGSGGGLSAAVTAAEEGAKVILIEKTGMLGGYTRQANGLMAVESPVQKSQNININKDEVFRQFMRWSHCRRVNPRVVRAFFNQTGETIEWLETKGVRFEIMQTGAGLPVVHLPVGMGAAVQKALIKAAHGLGITTLLNTRAYKIKISDSGEVTKVLANQEDTEITIDTKSVIIATGGFGDNRDLLKKYCRDYYDGMPVDHWPNHTAHSGDGLLMAEDIGAAIAESIPNYHMGPYYHPFLYPWQSLAAMAMNPSTIWVNKRGKRFIDEGGSFGMGVAGNAILMQPDHIMFTLFDDSIRQLVEEGKTGTMIDGRQKHAKKGGGTMVVDGKFPGLKEELGKEARKTDGVMISNSWDEIAEWIGAEPDILKTEIEEYNYFCETGYDALFTKDKVYLRPLKNPPFYAMKCSTRVGETLGGIIVNEKMEIINKEGKIIPGAYAAGVIANGFEPEDYNREIAGCAMGFAVNSGRIAGRNAARFVLSKKA